MTARPAIVETDRAEACRVLLLDTTQYFPSSPLFAEALERCESAGVMRGVFIDEAPGRAESVVRRVATKVGAGEAVAFRSVHKRLVAESARFDPHVVLVVKGAHVPKPTLAQIRERTGAVLVNFATDDPFNPRTSPPLWREALPAYDLVCTPRRANIDDLLALGVPEVQVVPFAYKPEVHFPEAPRDPAERERFQSDVCFIGGADADRFVYFERVIEELPGVRLSLYGGYWNQSPRLAPYWRGFATGRDFRLAVGGAALSVNLVRRANRDDHVMRTFEVPACGGCLLTEPTAAHRSLFAGDREAFFFESADDLAGRLRRLLGEPERRARVAAAGHRKVTEGGNRYDDRLRTIVDLAMAHRRGAAGQRERHAARI